MPPRAPLVVGPDGLPQNLQPADSLYSAAHAAGPYLLGLPNGNFEDGLTGWSQTPGGTGSIAIDATAGNQVTGANSVKLVTAAASDRAQIASGLFPCGARIPLSIFAMAKSAGSVGRFVLYVAWFDRTKTALTSTPNTVLYAATIGTAFSEIGASIVPPAGTAYGQAFAYLDTAADTVWVDEIVVNREDVFDFDLRNFQGVGDGATDDTAALQIALAFFSRGGGGTLCVRAVHYLNPSAATTITIPANVELKFGPVGRFKLGANATLSVVGRINAGAWQIFDTATVSGGVVNTSGDCRTPVVLPEWWGAAPTGGPVAPSASVPGSDCSPAITAAQAFISGYPGRIIFCGLFYNCLSTLIINSTCHWDGVGGGLSGAYGGRTTLDFTNAPAGITGVFVNNQQANLFRMSMKNISIGRSTTAASGSGGYALYLAAVLHGSFTNLGLYGFDQNLILTNNSVNPCVANRFQDCYLGAYGLRSVLINSQTSTEFINTEIGNFATGEVVLISPPATSGAGATQDTAIFRDCRFGNNGAAYAQTLVRIQGGFWHNFERCDFESSTQAAIAFGLTVASSEMTPVATIDQCWFDDCGINVYNYGVACSFRVTNCPRMLGNPAMTVTVGGVTTNTPGAQACIFVGDSGNTTRNTDILIANNNMQVARSDASCVILNRALGAGINGNRCEQIGSAVSNAPIALGPGGPHAVVGNRLHSSAQISDGGTTASTLSANMYF